MTRVVLILSLISLGGCIYFFFIARLLAYGSIALLACVLLNCIYAMLSTKDLLKAQQDEIEASITKNEE